MSYLKSITLSWIIVFILIGFGYTEQVSSAFMFPQEQAKIIYLDIDAQITRAQSEYSLDRVLEDDRVLYVFKSQGKGMYDAFQDVVIEREAKMLEERHQLKVLSSKTHIKDKDGDVLASFVKTYSYSDGTYVFRHLDAEGEIVERKVFKIKGSICDDITMVHFLKGYLFGVEEGKKDFYLATNEPELYHVRLIPMKNEIIHLPLGPFEARKFQLMAELGPLTDIVARIVPKTYIWFQNDAPHQWLQYVGMESGYKSSKIMAYPLERTPPLETIQK